MISIICLLSVLFCAPAANSQNNLDPYETNDPEAAKKCLAQEISTPRTYSFIYGVKYKAFGPRPWYHPLKKIIPFWNDNETEKYSAKSVSALKDDFGLQIPLYESGRSKRIRLEIDEQLMRLAIEGENKWNNWLKKNPKATAEQKDRMEFQLRFQGLAAAKLPRFDWRQAGLNPGVAAHQGRDCNSCWAFASLDAFQMSRQLNARRANKTLIEETPPNVRQLLSCMIKNGAFCEEQNPDAAFSFLVESGLPLGGSSDYTNPVFSNPDEMGWTCDKTDSVKALTWDYVSGSPQAVPEPAEIKRAIVTYGAVVSQINFDDCLAFYSRGVFNEEQFGKGSHLLLIIGWDDLKEAWLVKNSYGREWGEDGFGWIKYGSNNIGQLAAFVVADPKAEERFLR